MQILHKQPEQEINVKAIILAGSRDFGRCPLASRLPLALWPILDKPVLEHLLLKLSHQGVTQATVCSNGDAVLLRNSLAQPNDMQLEFLDEKLPFGTAGCIREAAGNDADIMFVVFHAATLSPPNISELLEIHRSGKSILTVIEPDLGQGQPTGCASEIYVCEPAILEYISPEGYCDIKESLIAKMLRAGMIANLAVLREPFEDFHDRAGYLRTVANCLEHPFSFNIDAHYQRLNGSRNIWLADKAMLHPQARVYGPAVIMGDAVVSAHAVIFGPAIIGPNVSIGENCLIENSAFWAGASLGSNSRIRNCVVDYNVRIRPESIKADQAITKDQGTKTRIWTDKTTAFVNNKTKQFSKVFQPLADGIILTLQDWIDAEKIISNLLCSFGITVIVALLVCSYWQVFERLWNFWQTNSEYSGGLLVPFLALYILWTQRRKVTRCTIKPSIWGLYTLIIIQAMRYLGLIFMYQIEALSMIFSIGALSFFLFGWHLFSRTAPVLLFLFLMLPLPACLRTALMSPLQNVAAGSLAFSLRFIGYNVLKNGNLIRLNNTTLAVAETCNGLTIIISVLIIAGMLLLLTRRRWWQKLVILISTIPIALLCNAMRLTVTAIAFTMLKGKNASSLFHDFSGCAMMPLAVVLLVFEIWIMAKLTAEQPRRLQKVAW